MSILSFAKKISGSTPKVSKKTAAKVKTPNSKKSNIVKTVQDSSSKSSSGQAIGSIALMPLMSEKSVSDQASNTVVFRVVSRATKREIASAVNVKYKIKPVGVRTLRMSAKARRRGRTVGATNAWKKAYVKLPEGKTIDFSA